jgi:hypothetical protein
MAAVLFARGSRPEDNDLSRAIKQITDATTRSQVEGLVRQAHRTLITMMFVKSPVMLLLLLPLLLIVALIILPRFRDVARVMERNARGFVQLEADAVPA